MKKELNRKGFTLAELLIVVAIIAILIAIAIPVFTKQLEKSRDATTAANIRAAYAEATVDLIDQEDVKIDGREIKEGSAVKQYKCKVQSTDTKLPTFESSLPIEAKEDDHICAPGAKNIMFVVSGGNIVGWYFDTASTGFNTGDAGSNALAAGNSGKFYPSTAAIS